MTEIVEAIEGEFEARAPHKDERFRKLTGVYLGIVAVLLAITTLGSSNSAKVITNAARSSSDLYVYYFEKTSRQTAYQLSAEQLESQLAAQPGLSDRAKILIENTIKRYRERADRYESDPTTGDGKKELLFKTKEWEDVRHQAEERDSNFGLAQALFQAAIALGSASIVAASRLLVSVSGIIAAMASFLMINGYFLILRTPFE
jgi:hypothetical protein